jgi:hypothetical protein
VPFSKIRGLAASYGPPKVNKILLAPFPPVPRFHRAGVRVENLLAAGPGRPSGERATVVRLFWGQLVLPKLELASLAVRHLRKHPKSNLAVTAS